MKIAELLNHEAALQKLNDMALKDAQLAWELSEAMDEVKKHLARFHEKRDALIKQHGTLKKGSDTEYDISDKKSFNEAVNKLLDVTVKVNFPRIKLNQLNGVEASASDMSSLRELKILLKSAN